MFIDSKYTYRKKPLCKIYYKSFNLPSSKDIKT